MKVGILGNYSVDFIAKEFGKNTESEVFISDYCQYSQLLAFSDSELYKFKPDFTLLILDGNELGSVGTFEGFLYDLKDLVSMFLSNSKSGYLVISNIYIMSGVNSYWDYNKNINAKKYQAEFNLALNKLSVQYDRVFILDQLSIIEKYGSDQIYDESLWVYAKNRFNKKGLRAISKEIEVIISAILNNTKKCLVLDLDNTMWGGVLGEDGINGIKLGADGVARIYLEVQKNILLMKEKGVLLTICSKNNLTDVQEFFSEHPSQIMKLNDFVTYRINWDLKSENIKSIAKELNISEDSMVFIDDNPVERDLVRGATNCIVPDFPNHVESLLNFIFDLDKKYFSKYNVTHEDRTKTIQYIENAERNIEKGKFESYENFVNSLDMKIAITRDSLKDVARLSQLTQKTNQFNFTTKRYSDLDIQKIIQSNDSMIFSGAIKDKYGDYGIVIMAIIIEHDNHYEIDTFLMSCRVIGKMVEDVFLPYISSKLREGLELKANYIPSQKNKLVENKLDELGFEEHFTDKSGVKHYTNVCPVLSNKKIHIEVSYEG